MAVDVERISSGFLRALGAPAGPLMSTAVKAWMQKEGITSAKRNNPWNLHGGAPCLDPSGICQGGGTHKGQTGRANVGPGDKNVAIFGTLDAGIEASAANLINLGTKDKSTKYEAVVAAARAGDPVRFLNALAVSKWSANRYGTKNGGKNALIKIWNDLTGRQDDPFSYKTGVPGPIIEEDELDPRTHLPVAVCDITGPTPLFSDSRGQGMLVPVFNGATNVGLYARPIAPAAAGVLALAPIRVDMKSGPAEDLRIGWVAIDRISNIRIG